MGRRRPLLFLSALALAVSACSEQESQLAVGISGPDIAPAAVTTTSVCSFSGLNQLIVNYFPSNRQSGILTLRQSMASAGEDTQLARTYGFEIMDSIGRFSRELGLNPTAGAQLTLGLIACMFANQDTIVYPADPVEAFSNALTSADGGAYYVRGGHLPGRSAAVLGTEHPSVGSAVNLSGVEPLEGTWLTTLAGNTASDGRVLIYGYRTASGPLVYEWSTVPSRATFTPALVVSVCEDEDSGSAMVHESNVGVLAYAFTDVCDESQSLTMRERGWSSKLLASRLVRIVAEALSPEPLQATMLLLTKSGGTATTFKSEFSNKTITDLILEFLANKPPSNVVVNQIFPVELTVSAQEGPTSLAVLGVCVFLTGANNNGQPTDVLGDRDDRCNNQRPEGVPATAPSTVTEEFTPAQSKAIFQNVKVTKSGGLILTATARVINRDGFGAVDKKLNVKPK